MRVVRHPSEIPVTRGEDLGFVPTMGALHQGHLSLIRQAKSECQKVAVSIFVNPTQFGPNEDFSRYPRPLEQDLEMCESAGVDLVFNPDVGTMYSKMPTSIVVPEITDVFEGASRPGHFNGVATVVLKLFNIVTPTRAYFGLKDLQQCGVLKKMVEDLDLRIRLEFIPTLREPDGLAMSSRNRYLSAEERATAPRIFEELSRIASEISMNQNISSLLSRGVAELSDAGFLVDYLEYVNRNTFRPIREKDFDGAVIFAGKIGTTRLIDNVLTLV